MLRGWFYETLWRDSSDIGGELMDRNVADVRPVLAIIPGRGGSRGLPGKNIRPLGGLPLIAHSIRLAKMCPEIARTIVTTDSEEIAAVAREYGADVPFLRPADLAQDETPMWPVLRHALNAIETMEARRYGSVLLLDPTSPGRLPADVAQAVAALEKDKNAVGVIGVSEPHFNPRWVCVESAADGYMRQSFPGDKVYTRRQDVPVTYRINGCLYLWRRDHVAGSAEMRLYDLPHRMVVISEERAVHIDELHDFRIAEMLVREKLIRFPWTDIDETHG